MELKQSQRNKVKIKMALKGPSSSGKTMGAILLAKGLAKGDLSKVAVIDTENGSANLYSHLGKYNVLKLESPYTEDKYIKAIELCEKAGMDVIIIDSISHFWLYLLDFHSSIPGNSFTNWQKINPLEKKFMDKVLHSNTHIIVTMRTKQDYVLNLKDGKYVPEKIGLKSIQRDSIDYEFTIVFDLNINHLTTSSKDRSQLFERSVPFIINSSTGKRILDWCNSTMTKNELQIKVSECNNMQELTEIYNKNFELAKTIEQDFVKKQKLLSELTSNINKNGNGTINK